MAKKRARTKATAKKKAKRKVKKKLPKKKAKKKVKKKRRPAPGYHGLGSGQPAFATNFQRGSGRVLVPRPSGSEQPSAAEPVPPGKIQAGLRVAREEIKGILDELEELSDDWFASKVNLEVSFSADGKFLGVGVGGATSINVEFSPNNDAD